MEEKPQPAPDRAGEPERTTVDAAGTPDGMAVDVATEPERKSVDAATEPERMAVDAAGTPAGASDPKPLETGEAGTPSISDQVRLEIEILSSSLAAASKSRTGDQELKPADDGDSGGRQTPAP